MHRYLLTNARHPGGSSTMTHRNTHTPDTHRFPFDTGRQRHTTVLTSTSFESPSIRGMAVPYGLVARDGAGSTKLVALAVFGRQHAALNLAFLFGLFLLLLLLSLLRLGTLARFRDGGPKETAARVKQTKPSRAGSHNGSRMTTPWPARHPRATHLTCECLAHSPSLSVPSLPC